MSLLFLHIADYGLIFFHTALVLFNCLGWIWSKTRRWNLICLAATAASWFLLGLWFGTGYCICTRWHWEVRAALGNPVTDDTYIQFLVRALSGWKPDANLVRTWTGAVFAVSVVMSLGLNWRDYRRRRPERISSTNLSKIGNEPTCRKVT